MSKTPVLTGAINLINGIATVKLENDEILSVCLDATEIETTLGSFKPTGVKAVVFGANAYPYLQMQSSEVRELNETEKEAYRSLFQFAIDKYKYEADHPPTIEITTLEQARAKRNALLEDSDWTALSDSPLDEASLKLWKAYRQELRDIFGKYSDPKKIVWPVRPDII